MLRRITTLLSAAGVVLAMACSQSDPGVTSAVKSRLAQDDTVKAYQIDVDTSDKVVTLTGTVDNPAAKTQAVTIARNTKGVREVIDHITVGPEATATTGAMERGREAGRETREKAGEAADATRDAARDAKGTAGRTMERSENAVTGATITSGVKAKLLADTQVSGLKIDVDTSDGVVTLSGTAATHAEADRAVKLARDAKGVKRVVDNIRISR